jgi:FMN phosphatase YigB (HAD superfamily)
MTSNAEIKVIAFDVGHTLIDERIDAATFVPPVHAMPHVADALLQMDLPLAAWSNTASAREAEVRSLLTAAGIGRFFRWVVTSIDAGCRKPSAAFFRFALERCGVCETEVLFVGNQLNTDICGGRDCRIRTVWLSGEAHRSPEETLSSAEVKPDYSIDSMAELPALLQRIRKSSARIQT